MTITLPPELEASVEAEVASGKFPSTNEVLKQAVLMLCEHQRREALQLEIDKGLEESQAGRTLVFDETAVERIKAKGRALRLEKAGS